MPEQLTKSGSCGFGGGVGVTEGEGLGETEGEGLGETEGEGLGETEGEGLGETEGEGLGDGFTFPPPSLLSLQALSMMPAAEMTDKSLNFMV